MHTQKHTRRKEMKAVLAQLSPRQRAEFSQKAGRHLLASKIWIDSCNVCLFVSYGNEIETRTLLESAWQQGKNVYLPKCWTHKEGAMDFFLCCSSEDLQPGLYGIMEPSDKAIERGRLVESPDIIIVPGLGFTPLGVRLGKGGGYYDRFMMREMCLPSKRIGFGFASQVVESLPVEAWDLVLHYICTESGLHRTPQPFEQTAGANYD